MTIKTKTNGYDADGIQKMLGIFNYYRFCPYCGTRLYTDPKLVSEGGLPKA